MQENHLFLTPLLFPLYLTLTAIWSANPLRACLTAGILWCLIITGVVIFTTFHQKKLLNCRKFFRFFFFSASIFCIICWLQSLLDILNVGREVTLLCSGCTSRMFGFPHPSGFAIEPQFMGNLLLAPTLLTLFFWTKPKPSNALPFGRRTLLTSTLLFSSTLFLTFSRGAIYAFALGFAVLFLMNLIKLKNSHFWKTLPLLALSAIFVIFAQGVFSALSPTNSTFLGGIEKSISQMTLGKINLSLETEPAESSFAPEPKATDKSEPVFSGYVEESTDTRLKFNRIALELAPESASSLIFGYGLGSAGEIMFAKGKTSTPFEIVQNEPLSLLLETGLIGILLALAAFVAILRLIIAQSPSPERYFLFSLITAFAFSLLFFSGLPNALHIYLFPALLAANLPMRPRSSRKPSLPNV